MNESFHTKHRPANLKQIIGHSAATSRLRGMIEGGSIPGAILFTGPSSVGKTTLARALAVEINGCPIEEQQSDYREINAAETRTIDDMRELIKLSKFRPTKKKRIFVIDEAQQLLTNAAAAQAILKPIEDAGSTDTVWILCSMSPEKFGSPAGKAIANRCAQFVLTPPSVEDLTKQANRILRREQMDYVEQDAVDTLVQSCNGEFRTLANLIQAVRDHYVGSGGKNLDTKALTSVISSADSNDDALVVTVIVSALTKQYAKAHRALMDVADPFPFVNKLHAAAEFQLNLACVEGGKHPKLWWTPTNREITNRLKKASVTLGEFAALHECLVKLKGQAQAFAVSETSLASSFIYRFIKDTSK